MSIQQVVHISLSIPFYHSTRSFQFINTCNKHERPFVLLPQKILHNLPPTSKNIHCKSLIDKYKERHHSLKNVSLVEFIVSYNTKTCKKHGHDNYPLGFIQFS